MVYVTVILIIRGEEKRLANPRSVKKGNKVIALTHENIQSFNKPGSVTVDLGNREQTFTCVSRIEVQRLRADPVKGYVRESELVAV